MTGDSHHVSEQSAMTSAQFSQMMEIYIIIPELGNIAPFKRYVSRDCSFHTLYGKLVEERDFQPYFPVFMADNKSRHFWHGNRLLRRTEKLTDLGAAATNVSGGLTLVLRPDCYRVLPQKLVSDGVIKKYIDAERPISEAVEAILTREESPSCFTLYHPRKGRMKSSLSLLDYQLFPAREDIKDDTEGGFPAHAQVRLRPRSMWLPRLICCLALAVGCLTGYYFISHWLAQPH